MRTILNELKASLARNTSMTISLVVTMTVSLLLASLGLLIQAQADRTENYFGDRLQLQINMCTKNSPAATCIGGEATDEQKQAVQEALRANPEVKSISVRTSADNYEQAKELLGQTDSGRKQLETVGVESFPESYMVTLKDPLVFDGVLSQISGMDGVGGINSLRELLNPLFEALSMLQWFALGFAGILLLAAILQVSNTIRMTAHSRRREIGIMRLVGASSWHIQMPFVLESLIAALISAALAAGGVVAFMQFVVYDKIRAKMDRLTPWVDWSDAVSVVGVTVVFAILLALVPTVIMTRRHLRV